MILIFNFHEIKEHPHSSLMICPSGIITCTKAVLSYVFVVFALLWLSWGQELPLTIHLCFSRAWCSQSRHSEIIFWLELPPGYAEMSTENLLPHLHCVCTTSSSSHPSPSTYSVLSSRDNSVHKTFWRAGRVLCLCCPTWQPPATEAIAHLECE